MSKKNAFAAFAAATLIASCAQMESAAKRPNGSGPAPEIVTRLYLAEACPGDTKQNTLLEALFGVIFKPLIEMAIKGVGDSLKKAGEPEKTQLTTSDQSNFYKISWSNDAEKPSSIDLNVGCITIVRGELEKPATGADEAARKTRFDAVASALVGKFKPPEDSTAPAMQPSDVRRYLTPSKQGTDAVAAKSSYDLDFNQNILFFGQFAVTYSEDETAMRIRPKAVLIGDPLGKGNKRRDLVLTFAFQGPGQTGTGDAFAVSTVSLSNAKAGTFLSEDDVSKLSSGWFPLAPLHDDVAAALKARDTAQDDLLALRDLKASLQAQLTRGKGEDGKPLSTEDRDALTQKIEQADAQIARMNTQLEEDKIRFTLTSPVTLAATVTETQDGNKFLVDFGTFLSGNSEKLAEPLFNEFDPATRRAAKATEADAKDTLSIAAIEAVAAHVKAKATTGDDRDEVVIRTSEIKAKQACRKLKDAGYNEVDCLGYY